MQLWIGDHAYVHTQVVCLNSKNAARVNVTTEPELQMESGRDTAWKLSERCP